MIVKAPKNEKFDSGLKSLGYRVISEDDFFATYEGVFGVKFDMASMDMKFQEFISFCECISVNGGKKVRRGSTLYIRPIRNKFLTVRLSPDEYEDLKMCAKDEDMTPRECFRDFLMRGIAKRRRML